MRWNSSWFVPVAALGLCVTALCATGFAQAPRYNFGRAATPEEIKSYGVMVGPAGKELPPGSGSAKEGAAIYAKQCASCHGKDGEGTKVGPDVIGGKGSLASTHPVRTPGSLFPYATTIWSYIKAGMPANKPGSLSDSEVYALTAFLLYRHEIVKESDVLDAKSLPKVQMPNRNGFVPAVPVWPETPAQRRQYP